MEYLSERKFEKYEDILREIDETNTQCENLQKAISKINDRILTAKVALYQRNLKKKIFQVRVKLFSSLFQMYDTYGETITATCMDFMTQTNIKFYAVEVYVSRLLQHKITKQSWIVNTTIKNSKHSVSQSMPLNKSFENPLRIIVPFSNSLETTEVSTKILLASEHSWTIINLGKVTVDISYHFESNLSRPISKNLDMKIMDLIETNRNLPNLRVLRSGVHTYKFVYKCSNSSLLTTILKNCYHNLDFDVLNELKQESQNFAMDLSTGNSEKCIISFDRSNNTLCIKANLELLGKVKKYFLMNLETEHLKPNKNVYSQLMVGYIFICQPLAEIN